MGREIKRVPLNFAWPKDKIWEGFQNPHYEGHCTNCPMCDGTGYSPQYKRLEAQWYGNEPFKPEDRGSTPFAPTHPKVWAFAERNVTRSPGFYGTGEEAIRREAVRLAELFNNGWNHHINDDDVKALVKADRLKDFTHTWSRENGWQWKKPRYIPTAREVNEWSIDGMAHDSINCWVVVKAECDRRGYPQTCAHCKGEGQLWDSRANKTRANRWRSKQPPKGAGYQLWGTVSEGSPISPVFAKPEDLADWLVTSMDYKWARNDRGTTREQWLRFINGPGWAPSLVSSPETGVVSGVQAVTT